MSELKFYPLTSSQQMMFFSLKYSYKKSIVNICSSVDFKGEIDPKIMLQALSLGMLRNPSNSIRLRMVGKQVMQYFSEQAPDKIDVLDLPA